MIKFMPMANPDISTTETWQGLFDNGNVGIIDPESMKYVSISDTEGHLMVAGAVSGNIVTYKVLLASYSGHNIRAGSYHMYTSLWC